MFFILFFQGSFFAQEEDNTGNWFIRDRAYPYDTIPVTSMINALDYQKDMTDANGYALSLQWINIGPKPVLSGGYPITGRVASVKYYPNVAGYEQHPNWIYIAGHDGGVWKSENSGLNFLPISDGLQSQSSGDIAFDPNNPNIIYYGTGGKVYGYGFNYYGIGVYKSTNAGQTWDGPFKTGFRNSHIQTFKITVNPANSNHVYLACGTDPFYGPNLGGGLYKSTDGGITWDIAPGTPANTACNDVVIYYNQATQTNIIYAAGMFNFGFFISTNGGLNFSQQTGGVFNQGGRTQLAIPNPNSDRIYAVSTFNYGAGNPNNGVYAYYSTNRGLNFTRTPVLTGATVDYSATTSFLFIEASPHNPLTSIIGFGTFYSGGGLYRTTNGGNTYDILNPPWADQNSLAFNPYTGYENEVILGDDQGLFKSTNLGTNWPTSLYLNGTLSLSQLYRIAVSPDDQNYFAAVTDAGFFKKQSGT